MRRLRALRDVRLEQIRAGMAWHYKDYQHGQTTQDRLVYRDEEENARVRRGSGCGTMRTRCRAYGRFSCISGGEGNIAGAAASNSGRGNSVSGGKNRIATGDYNWAAGGLLENQ
jgi:hypothetical protein